MIYDHIFMRLGCSLLTRRQAMYPLPGNNNYVRVPMYFQQTLLASLC